MIEAGWLFFPVRWLVLTHRDAKSISHDRLRVKKQVGKPTLFSFFVCLSRKFWTISLGRVRRAPDNPSSFPGLHSIAPLRAISFRLFKIYAAAGKPRNWLSIESFAPTIKCCHRSKASNQFSLETDNLKHVSQFINEDPSSIRLHWKIGSLEAPACKMWNFIAKKNWERNWGKT